MPEKAKPVQVAFKEVGGNQVSWTEVLPRLDYGLVLKAIRRKGALASKSLEIEIEEEDGHAYGTIFVGGFRAVGKFTITAAPPEARR